MAVATPPPSVFIAGRQMVYEERLFPVMFIKHGEQLLVISNQSMHIIKEVPVCFKLFGMGVSITSENIFYEMNMTTWGGWSFLHFFTDYFKKT